MHAILCELMDDKVHMLVMSDLLLEKVIFPSFVCCLSADCSPPPSIPALVHSPVQTTYTNGSTVLYTCVGALTSGVSPFKPTSNGLYSVGTASAQCSGQPGSLPTWSTSVSLDSIICSKGCFSPFGAFVRYSVGTTAVTPGQRLPDGVKLTGECSTGYERDAGDTTLTCDPTGVFLGTPLSCKPRQCPKPPSVTAAHFSADPRCHHNTTAYDFACVVTYTCDLTHLLVGSARSQCYSHHTTGRMFWVNVPYCKG